MSSSSGNRLARESSPYLRLHAGNPVDWYPWGDEAFDAARRLDRPIFLSVGYSSCYWCHVMERDCFSSEEIAKAMNDAFVSIKVDREERPDVDEIYMTATQLLTGSGGWPNSVFLTPDLEPFFAGTYFPPSDTMGRPGFPRVLASLRGAWALRRREVMEQAEIVAKGIRAHMEAGAEGGRAPDGSLATEARDLLARRFDAEQGGFGDAPKFPSPANLFLLLDLATAGDEEARGMLVTTLGGMAQGGIHDQLGGGFHRYSTDAAWLVPHFEKMLYDNASLGELYALSAPLAPEAGFSRVARQTLDFVLREMTGREGAFLSAIDAETDGSEGAYYTWTREEIESVLGTEQSALLAPVFGFDGPPNFEDERYVLHLPRPLEEQARGRGVSLRALLEGIEPSRQALLSARSRRKRPLTDDKVLTDWNGLMISAMARAGAALSEKRYLAAARAAADFVLARLKDDSGRLLHSHRDGISKIPALLDDYAFLIDGLLSLHAADGEGPWLEQARRLMKEQDERLLDATRGAYFAAADSKDLLARSRPGHDGAVVSGNGVSALNLLALARMTGDASAGERAQRLLACFSGALSEYVLGHLTLVRAAMRRNPSLTKESPRGEDVRRKAKPEAAVDVVSIGGTLGAQEGTWRPFTLTLEIRKGWHVNANAPLLRFLVPTEVKGVSGRLRDLKYPDSERYEGRVTIEGFIEGGGGTPAVLTLSYQPCDEERCLEPVVREVELG